MERGLYIHIPFCVHKCAYCDFASFAAGEEAMEAYVSSLLREMAARRSMAEGAAFSTVFFGGGTPSLLPLPLLERVATALRDTFAIDPRAEWTLEANPGTLSRASLSAYRDMGWNRLSVGLQAAQPRLLAMLGRIHTLEEFREATAWAGEAGFSNVNADVMASLPGQTVEDLLETLEEARAAGVQHISLYSLQVEEGTPLARRIESGALALPGEDEAADALEAARAALEDWGYRRYEVSNFAQEGYACRHNLVYWHYGAWLGLGCSAASQWEGARWSNPDTLDAYAAWVQGGCVPDREALAPWEQAFEAAMVGLRLTRGISRVDYCRRFGLELVRAYPRLWEKFRGSGLADWDAERLWLTPAGLDVMNGILVTLLETMEPSKHS